jgi:hypothetical protein
VEVGEAFDDARGAEQFGEDVALVVGQLQDLAAGVRVIDVVDHEISPAAAVAHDADALTGLDREVVAQPDAR